MAVRVRLSRIGRIHSPYYRIVAVDSRAKRDGAHLQDLGTFDPIRNVVITLDQPGIENWVKLGAQCSDSVKKIVKLHQAKQKASAA